MKKAIVDLYNFSYNRKISYRPAIDELFQVIEQYTEQKELASLFNHFNSAYGLPSEVTKQKIKLYIAKSYIYKKSSFDKKLSLASLPKSMLSYCALFYALIFIKNNNKVNQYKLIIDDICSSVELDRFENLIELVGKENTLIVLRNIDIQDKYEGYNFYTKKFFRDFNKIDLLKAIFKEFFFGFWIVLKVSLRTRVNLFPISLQIIHGYLSFKSFFETNEAEYTIQERHYNTDSIKNYLFKKSGGVSSTTIQKNIVEADLMFAYMDIDVLFSLGSSGFQRFLDFGGRINKIQPVGSLFMEHYWFKKPIKLDQKFDILFLGINVTNGVDRIDKYDGWADDYYSSFKWLVKIKNYNPKLRIAIKHHASAGIEDPIELSILKNSGIIISDKNLNSYQLSFSSKCVITYGSTMGYELSAHGITSLFFDPGYRCAFLPEKEIDNLDLLRITSYEKFKESINQIFSSKDFDDITLENKLELCLESSHTSNNIFNYFQDKNTN